MASGILATLMPIIFVIGINYERDICPILFC